jgi:uncharacterized protein with HEPN domain
MPFRDPQRHLEDMLDAIEKIEEFIGDIDLTAYRADEKTKAAVERKIQILTEAIVRLEDESPGAYPEIDQKGYRGMGNILRHSYHRVDDKIVWSTVKEDLPEPRDIVEKLLRALPAQKSEPTPNAEE